MQVFGLSTVSPCIVRMEFGSRLYQLATTDSDTDYTGVYIPSEFQLVTGNYEDVVFNVEPTKERNTKDSVDDTNFSLLAFVKLAAKGDNIAIDMLHCESPLVTSKAWEFLRSKRSMFYSVGVTSYLATVKKSINLMGLDPINREEVVSLLAVLDTLPKREVLKSVDLSMHGGLFTLAGEESEAFKVLGKTYSVNHKVGYIAKCIRETLRSYDARNFFDGWVRLSGVS